MTQLDSAPEPDRHKVEVFEDRYGVAAYSRLLALFDEPCTSFADIAAQFGVTRERVRQWHLEFRPGAPRGHQRRRLCLKHQQKRELLTDPVFRAFYRQARAYFDPQRFSLIAARSGFRRRSVRLDGRLVVLRTSRTSETHPDGAAVYRLSPQRRAVDFVYYQLSPDAYLFLPGVLVPPAGTTFVDHATSKYWPYRNTFAAAQLPPLSSTHGDSLHATTD